MKTLKERLINKIELIPFHSCWEWIASKHKDGYGLIKYNNKTSLTHRMSYIVFKGEIPKGMCVCHKCDNPSCINPDHLFLGTPKDNMRDKISKKRHASFRGEKSPNAKITKEDVIEIRKNYVKNSRNNIELAKKYSISTSHLRKIIRNERWGLST